MDTTIDQQVARDEALVPHAKRLRIGRSNFRLLSDIKSKESTLQLVYDVLRLSPFFKAFQMDNKKHIVNLESFREMLHICPRLPHQPFVEPPFEEEILAFLWFLRHNGLIRKLTDVEHKDTKKSNVMYYPRFTKVIIHYFMSKDPSIPRRNKVNWHYVRDDHMFSMIKLVSRYQNTQQFGALPPIELTNDDIRNSNAYKEYYAVAIGATPPKPKASVWKTRSSSDTTITPLTTAAGPRLTTSEKGKQAAKASKANSLSALSEEGSDDRQAFDEEEFIHPSLSTHAKEETRDEESFDPISKTPKNSDGEGTREENIGINAGREEGHDEEEDEDELYRDININQGRGIQMTQEFKDSHVTLTPVNPDGQQQSSSMSLQFVTSMLNPTPNAGMESIFETTLQIDWMNEAVKVAIQIQFDRLHDEAQADNDEFLKNIDENMQRSLRRRSKNKSRNLYKALVEAYKSDKIILDTYRETVTLKRRRDDEADKDKEPSAGSYRGSKRRREGKDHESQSDSRSSFNELMDTPVDFSNSLMNRLQVDTLTPNLLAGPTYELMKGSCKSLGRKRQQFYGFAVNRESALDVYSKRRIIAVTGLKIIEWHNYKHLDWIPVRRDDDKLYEFKEGDFKRLRIQDIEDMRVEDLQLGVESYQKKLNLTKLDTYCFDLKHKEAYIAYSDPRGFIYQNKDKKNRLMRVDELHKFSDGTLTNGRTALDDRLKGI
nr:hypothetical protein [Tanacetum cinerariifolium]